MAGTALSAGSRMAVPALALALLGGAMELVLELVLGVRC